MWKSVPLIQQPFLQIPTPTYTIDEPQQGHHNGALIVVAFVHGTTVVNDSSPMFHSSNSQMFKEV